MGRPHRAQTPFAIVYFADRSVFLLDPIEEDLIIRPLGDLDLLRHAPSQRLLVQRNKSSLLVNDPERLRDQVVALFEIGLNEDLLVQLINLGVAVAPVIELRSIAVGVAAAGEIGNDIPAVERAWGPAQEVERRVILRRRPRLLEVFGLRLSQEVHLHVYPSEHGDDGLADRLVVDVAIIGAINRDLETVRQT